MKIKYQKEIITKQELFTPEINTNECFLSWKKYWKTYLIWFFFCEKYKNFYYLTDNNLEINKIDKNWLSDFSNKIKEVFENYDNVKIIDKDFFIDKIKEFKEKILKT